jgi:hypothetical protein
VIREVAIADCVHFCGFRYGRDDFNPYENYITGLAAGEPATQLRDRFVDFILHYRPRHLGEALGVVTLKPIPLWLLPWKSWLKLLRPGAWQESTACVLDILTYFTPRGVEWHRIEEEFSWMERALATIREPGYRPEHFGYIEVFELRAVGFSRFLVLDGNHRLGALHALGHQRVMVRQRPFHRARRTQALLWPLVLSGHVPHLDALAIFDGYIAGNHSPHRAEAPAALLLSSPAEAPR